MVETDDFCYLVEIKGEDMLENKDVLLKKESAISYCRIATAWATNKLFKAWKYTFLFHQKK